MMTNGCLSVFRRCLGGRGIISEANPAQENQSDLDSNLPAETGVDLVCLVLEKVGSKATGKPAAQVWRWLGWFWVWKNWKIFNIH